MTAKNGIAKAKPFFKLAPTVPVIASTAIVAVVVSNRIKSWVKSIKVSAVQVILHEAKTFPKSLKMHNLSCPQKFDDIINIWVIFYKTQNIVICGSGFLFWHDCVKTTTLETRINTRYFFVLAFSGCNFVKTT